MSTDLPHTGGGEPLLVEYATAEAATLPTYVGVNRGGRKPLEGGRVTAAFVLRQDQANWVAWRAKTVGLSKSEYMREIIDHAMTTR